MFHATPAWLVWLFLFSTQLPFTTASAPLPEDPQCVQLEKLSGWEAAYDYHQNCPGYHIRYFEMKLETLQSLQLGSWYFDQIAQIYKNNPDYLSDNITEAEVFARHMSNDAKFECGILNPSCNYHSKPRDIIDRQRVLCPKCKPKELMEESQKVKFALDGIATINKLHSTVYVSEDSLLCSQC
jgi:hypothetical protein